MELASTVNQEDFQNLFTDFTPLGLVTTERPSTHGLFYQVENIAAEPLPQQDQHVKVRPESELTDVSLESTSMENVTPNATASDRKRVRGQDNSEVSITIAQARREARAANEEKRIAALNQARAEVAAARIAAVNLKKDNEDITADIQATMKQIEELTKENKSLTKSVEDRIEELTREYPVADGNGSIHPETMKIITLCNSILERVEKLD